MAAAQYGVASRFLVPVAVLLASYTSIIQPEATRWALTAQAALGAFLSQALRLVLVLALPFVAGTWLLAREALVWLVWRAVWRRGERARFASGKRLPLSLVMIVVRGLVATNHQRVALLGNLTGVVSCCLLGWWFIRRFGATGAAAHLQIAQNCFSGREGINRFIGC